MSQGDPRMSLKYYTSPVSASALFLDQSDLSIPLNSQSQVVRTRMAAMCSTLVADVDHSVSPCPFGLDFGTLGLWLDNLCWRSDSGPSTTRHLVS